MTARHNLRHPKRWAIAALASAGCAGLVVSLWQARVTAEPQPESTAPQPMQAMEALEAAPVRAAADSVVPGTPGSASQAAGSREASPDARPSAPPKPPQDPDHAHIRFSVIPSTNAKVVWGRQTLGVLRWGRSLEVVRPRDSGPLDVVIYAPGYLPVQTRAHTFEDSEVVVRLTKPEDMPTLWGYRAPLDAGVPDAGETEADAVPTVPEEVTAQPL